MKPLVYCLSSMRIWIRLGFLPSMFWIISRTVDSAAMHRKCHQNTLFPVLHTTQSAFSSWLRQISGPEFGNGWNSFDYITNAFLRSPLQKWCPHYIAISNSPEIRPASSNLPGNVFDKRVRRTLATAWATLVHSLYTADEPATLGIIAFPLLALSDMKDSQNLAEV
ncbi:hypothetical protein B0H19DRAFT_1241726, partial [Mycena capillaripes]